MKVDFDKSNYVSSTNLGRDILKLRILNLDVFRSEATMKPIPASSFSNGQPVLAIDLPPMISDQAQADDIKNGADTGGTIVSFLSTGNFFLSLILGGSMQQLWGMIRAL